MENTIENIATKMRMLAAEIGGNHHSPKEAEKLLAELADDLSEVNINMSIKLHSAVNEIDEITGISDRYRFWYQKAKNIKKE